MFATKPFTRTNENGGKVLGKKFQILAAILITLTFTAARTKNALTDKPASPFDIQTSFLTNPSLYFSKHYDSLMLSGTDNEVIERSGISDGTYLANIIKLNTDIKNQKKFLSEHNTGWNIPDSIWSDTKNSEYPRTQRIIQKHPKNPKSPKQISMVTKITGNYDIINTYQKTLEQTVNNQTGLMKDNIRTDCKLDTMKINLLQNKAHITTTCLLKTTYSVPSE